MKKHLLFLATCLVCSAIVLAYSQAEFISMINKDLAGRNTTRVKSRHDNTAYRRNVTDRKAASVSAWHRSSASHHELASRK